MKRNEKGFVLVVCLIFLAIMTLIAVFMFDRFTQDERISGNNREKSRAIDAAQTALDYSKNWMSQAGNVYATGNFNTGVACTTTAGAVNTAPVICSDALQASIKAMPSNWLSSNITYAEYAPTPSNSANSLMTVASNGKNTYTGKTKYYIQYLGPTLPTGSAPPTSAWYKVTASATGGNADAVTVVEAVYNVQTLSRDVGGS